MANITIDRGESVSLGFEINGIVITDLLDLQIYVGEWVFKLSDATITQDVSNTRLFFVKLNSTLTNRCVGTMPISLAVVTDLLGVNKQSNIASLIVKETNQKTVLNDLAEYIAGTFVVTIDLAQVTTNVILENIYRVESVNAVDSVNGQTGVVVLDADDISESATRLWLTPAQATSITTNTATFLIATATVELDSTLTNFFYAPRNLKINSTTNINGNPTVTIKVNNVAYTLGTSILRGALITLNSNVIGVVNLNIVYE
jgi:hypothetical protein